MSAGSPPQEDSAPQPVPAAEDLRRRVGLQPPTREPVFPNLLEIFRSLLSVIVVAMSVITFIVQPFRIPSESMERTLLVGDFLLVNKMAFAPPGPWAWLLPYHTVQRGDIIVFHFPLNPPEHVVKRVIGVPGDRVHLQDGYAWVNGVSLDEPYAVFEPAYADNFRDNFPTQIYSDPGVNPTWWKQMHADMRNGDLIVPPGEYFVLGDNRNFSRDSRYWGFVPSHDLVGRPLLVYFSLREPSRTDVAPPQDDRLGQKNDLLGKLEKFARWNRCMRVIR